MNYDNEYIDTLITRYLASEATVDEVRQLEEWMDASVENKKYFDGIRFAHDKVVASRPIIAFDTDKAWQKVQIKMHTPTVNPLPVAKIIPFYQKTVFRVAASVALIVGLSTITYWSVNRLNTIQPAMIEAVNEVKTTSLPDSSKIVINTKSQVAYAKGFGKTNRQVTLKGEAFFDVKHDSALPFLVKTNDTYIKDVGTSFNVKSYPDSTFVEVYVESGEVMFYSMNNPGITLLPGETGIFDKTTNTFKKLNNPEPKSLKYVNRVFVFEKIRLGDAVQKLNAVYCQQILISDRAISNMEITVTFENESLENMVQVIVETLGLKVDKQENGWLITN